MAALCAAVLGAASAAAQGKPETAGIETHGIAVRARDISSFAKAGAQPTLSSRLEWRGGLVLSSESENFGGWSGLVLSDDGKSLLAVSDSGVWMSGTLSYDGKRPKALEAVRLGPLRAIKGVPLSRRRERDSEAITLASGTPRNGSAYVAFEQIDRIGLFEIRKGELGKPSRYIDMPKEAASMRTDGIEGLTVLAGGVYKGSLMGFRGEPVTRRKSAPRLDLDRRQTEELHDPGSRRFQHHGCGEPRRRQRSDRRASLPLDGRFEGSSTTPESR